MGGGTGTLVHLKNTKSHTIIQVHDSRVDRIRTRYVVITKYVIMTHNEFYHARYACLVFTSKEPVCPRVEFILKIIIILLIIFLGFIKSKPC